MNRRIILFNLIFYSVTLFFYYQGKQDQSSSLGYGFFILIFWGVALLTLLVLLLKKVIQPISILDKIGIFTATPILCILIVAFILNSQDAVASEWQFNKSNHRYKVLTYNYKGTVNPKRIEYYKSIDTVSESNPFPKTETWAKDSIWIYFSKNGDTLKRVKYSNDVEVK